ncbi:hypothetical protein B0H16DRAFT_1743616 [Mycena metata]|uniref:Uncharacterized protein n=1 Tax=Mycena metata TaxID=1033252 RepID=A0AAD7H5T4_9AGAR|nr:hypothetical protein B0H16DRAFT_1743616 [Mycena metata]
MPLALPALALVPRPLVPPPSRPPQYTRTPPPIAHTRLGPIPLSPLSPFPPSLPHPSLPSHTPSCRAHTAPARTPSSQAQAAPNSCSGNAAVLCTCASGPRALPRLHPHPPHLSLVSCLHPHSPHRSLVPRRTRPRTAASTGDGTTHGIDQTRSIHTFANQTHSMQI